MSSCLLLLTSSNITFLTPRDITPPKPRNLCTRQDAWNFTCKDYSLLHTWMREFYAVLRKCFFVLFVWWLVFFFFWFLFIYLFLVCFLHITKQMFTFFSDNIIYVNPLGTNYIVLCFEPDNYSSFGECYHQH